MIYLWPTIGFIGWLCLMGYRAIVDGVPNYSIKTYIPGLMFAFILGPITFLILTYIIVDFDVNYFLE